MASREAPAQVSSLIASSHAPRLGWKEPDPTTTTTEPPHVTPPVVSRSRPPAVVPGSATAGGGPCDRPSTCPQLRQCENGGSYEKGTSPQFYGAYQFADRSTWGMTPAEQDAHADEMFAQRGAQPWPICGRFLR